jgi:hypothetical protein
LYLVPAGAFLAAYLAAMASGYSHITQLGYLISSVFCVLGLSGLSSQTTARAGTPLSVCVCVIVYFL